MLFVLSRMLLLSMDVDSSCVKLIWAWRREIDTMDTGTVVVRVPQLVGCCHSSPCTICCGDSRNKIKSCHGFLFWKVTVSNLRNQNHIKGQWQNGTWYSLLKALVAPNFDDLTLCLHTHTVFFPLIFWLSEQVLHSIPCTLWNTASFSALHSFPPWWCTTFRLCRWLLEASRAATKRTRGWPSTGSPRKATKICSTMAKSSLWAAPKQRSSRLAPERLSLRSLLLHTT